MKLRQTPAALLLAGLAACAPKVAAPPPVVTTPKFPDFVFPVVPAEFRIDAARLGQQRGWQYLQVGDVRNAEREFKSLLKTFETFYPAEAALGYVELAERRSKEAVEWFERALKRNGSYVPALIGRGQAFETASRLDDALKSFEAAVAIDSSLTDLRQRIDVLRFDVVRELVAAARRAGDGGDYDEARRAYSRAIEASPESAFLYRDLGAIELKHGDRLAALEHLRRAVALDPTDGRSIGQIGEILEAQDDLAGAQDAYTRAMALDPSPAWKDGVERIRSRMDLAKLPAEYRAIATAPQLTRGDLAALIGIRLQRLLDTVGATNTIVITDARSSWASTWIMAVVRAGVMDVYANHAFQPRTVVRRIDLALAASRVLNLIARQRPALARQWQGARRQMSDLPPGHLNYPAASVVVSAGVLPLEGDAFKPTRLVTGAEAIEAVARLEALAATDKR
jgi:tetratricopeptide (TPR) repeat protein